MMAPLVDISQIESQEQQPLVDVSQIQEDQQKPWYSIPSIGEARKGALVDVNAMQGLRQNFPEEMKRRMDAPTGAIGSMIPVAGDIYEELAKLGDIPQRLILEGLTGRLGRYPTFGELQEELKQTSLANDERNALAQKMGPPSGGRAMPNVSVAMPGIPNVTQYPDYMGERFMKDLPGDTEQQKALRREVSPYVDPALYAADFARRQAPNQLLFDTLGQVANPVKAAEMLGIGKLFKWVEGMPRPIGFGTAKPRVPAPAPAMKNEPLPQGVYGISPGEMERIKAWKMSPDAAPDETITALERQWGENQKAATLGKPPLEDALLEQRKAALPEAYRKSEAIMDDEPIPQPPPVPYDVELGTPVPERLAEAQTLQDAWRMVEEQSPVRPWQKKQPITPSPEKLAASMEPATPSAKPIFKDIPQTLDKLIEQPNTLTKAEYDAWKLKIPAREVSSIRGRTKQSRGLYGAADDYQYYLSRRPASMEPATIAPKAAEKAQDWQGDMEADSGGDTMAWGQPETPYVQTMQKTFIGQNIPKKPIPAANVEAAKKAPVKAVFSKPATYRGTKVIEVTKEGGEYNDSMVKLQRRTDGNWVVTAERWNGESAEVTQLTKPRPLAASKIKAQEILNDESRWDTEAKGYLKQESTSPAPQAPPVSSPKAASTAKEPIETTPRPGESPLDFMKRTGALPIQDAQGGLGFIQPAREFKANVAKWYRENMDVLNAYISVGIKDLTAPMRAKVDPLVGAALNRLGTDPVKFNMAYNDWFVQQGLNVPPGLKDVILLNELQEEAANKIAWDFYDTMKKVPKADRELIYDIMTNPKLLARAARSNDPRIHQLGQIAYDQRKAVIQSGLEQVDLGLMTPETFSAHYGTYLPRLFERSQFGEQAGAKYPPTARKHIITDPYNLRRDAYIITYKENGRMMPPKRFGDNEALRDTQYKTMKQQPGITDVEKVDPIPPDVLIDLGQIKDVQYTLTRQKMVSAQNIAYARIYKYVDKMGEEWTLPAEITPAAAKKAIAPGAAGKLGQTIDYAYTKLPVSKRLGIMSGRWAKNEVYEELFRIDKSLSGGMQFGGDSTMGQIFNWYNRNLLGPWKAGKVLFDSAVYSGNILSTWVMYDTGGGRLTSIGKAIDILIKAKKGNLDPHYVNGKAAGVFRQNFALNDLMELKTVYLDQEKGGFNVAKAASKLANMAGQKAGRFYGAIDDTFRFAMFLQESENGASPAEALRIAQYWTISYRDAAKVVKLMQTMPLANTPFLTFYYYAIPRMLKAHLGLGPKGFDPMIALRFAKYPIIFKMVDFYNKKRLGILDKEDKLLPFLNPFRTPTPREEAIKTSWLKQDKTTSKIANAASDFWGLNPLVGSKTTMIDGKPTTEYQKLALARLTPVGNIAQFPIPFISDPIMKTIYEEKLNKSGFTGQPIRKPHGEYQHYIPEIDFALKTLLPTWTPPIPGVTKGGYSMEKTMSAINLPEGLKKALPSSISSLFGKQDFFGRKRDILPVAFDVILGVKQQPVIPKVDIEFAFQEIDKNIQDIDNEIDNIPFTMRGRPPQDIIKRKAELNADRDKWIAKERALMKVSREMQNLDSERVREWKMSPEQKSAPGKPPLSEEKSKAMLA